MIPTFGITGGEPPQARSRSSLFNHQRKKQITNKTLMHSGSSLASLSSLVKIETNYK